MKRVFLLLIISFSISNIQAQVIPNGTIDSIDELSKKETIYVPMSDGTLLATDVSVPMFRDSVVSDIVILGETYTLQVIPKNSQFIVYDSVNITSNSYRLPLILTRTPYNKAGEDIGSTIFPFLGYAYVFQDMRGRYESEGVYFPMYSDAWPKESYHPEISIPMDLTNPTDLNHALKHHDGSETIFYLADEAKRIIDYNLDGIMDTIPLSNGKIGMYGASALGNTQYQAISDIPFTMENPLECLLPIVASNEHYNTTLFNNGVFRNSLVNGWITGQLMDIDDNMNAVDNSLENNIHSSTDYGYTNKYDLSEDLIDWFVSERFPTSSSGAHPTSLLRKDLDASMAPINASGNSDNNGQLSRYKNLNKPAYHLTGWWDIFINGQIETFNNIRKENPGLRQKLTIGPWTHQTIGTNKTGDEIYPSQVYDVLNFDLNLNTSEILNDPVLLESVYNSELLNWFRIHLGGEPFFIIQESTLLQNIGDGKIRIPSKDYVIPYYQFLNYIGKQATLSGLPVEFVNEDQGTTLEVLVDLPLIENPLINLSSPLTRADVNKIDDTKNVRLYISGPSNDNENTEVGNYWFYTDSLPFLNGISNEYFYLHQNQTADGDPPTSQEGTLSYVADPNNPVITIGGNNMIPNIPNENRKSQGSINLANLNYAPLTMDRSDVLSFETAPLSDTMTVIGFPKAGIYAKGKTTTYNTAKTDFDIMVRILDVYPDGREMFITEGVVNAKSREYAKSIFQADTNETIVLSNINNDEYYYFEFDLLPLGHTFGKNHRIKFLLNSSNYPRYQSNPHIPNEDGEFFRWSPGDNKTYTYQGQELGPQNAEITYNFNHNSPSYIMLPKLGEIDYSGMKEEKIASFLKVYPNPTKNEVTIEWNKSIEGNIELYDLMGNLVNSIEIKQNQFISKVDTGMLHSGIYLIRIPQLNVTKKLIIE